MLPGLLLFSGSLSLTLMRSTLVDRPPPVEPVTSVYQVVDGSVNTW